MATKYNSFKLLEEEQIRQNPHVAPEIENNLQGNMRFARMMGDVLELYLPKVFDLLITFFGGQPSKEQAMDGQSDLGTSPKGQANK